ncbi:ATP-binding protein [Streptomyces chrestomyceticus]|uniref:ATP-binding protein n=1 Tax=Streptomyces chrestomyceticus TaxID=68185 RepID=UPI0033C36BE8
MPMMSCGAPAQETSPPASHPTFPGTSRAAAHARTYARQIVERSVPGIAEGPVRDVELVVSELVTNAIRYGTEPGDRITVAVIASLSGVRIEVHDPVRRRPRHKPHKPARQRGRGLLVVGALANSWGVADRPLGKIVWAELAW